MASRGDAVLAAHAICTALVITAGDAAPGAVGRLAAWLAGDDLQAYVLNLDRLLRRLSERGSRTASLQVIAIICCL